MKESSDVLCDRATGIADVVRDVVLGVKGVKDCHRIRTRGRSDDIHVDLHILVDANMAVSSAHELNDNIERVIKENIKGVSNISIHIEPYDANKVKKKQ